MIPAGRFCIPMSLAVVPTAYYLSEYSTTSYSNIIFKYLAVFSIDYYSKTHEDLSGYKFNKQSF